MGLGHFLHGVGEAVGNVAKGVEYVADPRHLDDIARGVGKAGEFAVEHPGKVWDTGFEVGRAVVKDQLTPQNLAINAGLLALTVATAGATAPAFAAKLGLGAKSLEAGISAAKGIETAADITKGIEAGSTAVKGVEAAEAGAKAVEAGTTLTRSARFAQDVQGTMGGIREASGMAKADKILNAATELKGAGREAVGLSRYGGMAAQRASLAEKVAAAGEDSGAVGEGLSKFAAKKIAGEGNSLADPELYNSLDRMRHRVNQVQAIGNAPQDVAGANAKVQMAADPMKAVEGRVSEEIDKRSRTAGYTDRGETTEDIYHQTPPGTQPGAFATGQAPSSEPMLALPSGRSGGQMTQAQSPYTPGGSNRSAPYAMQGSGGNAFGTPPPTTKVPNAPSSVSGSSGGSPPSGPSSSSSTSQPGQPGQQQQMKKPRNLGAWKPSQHLWEGPRSQWLGGVGASFDWRNIDPLRKIESPTPGQATAYKQYKGKMSDYTAQQKADDQARHPSSQPKSGAAQEPINDQGAPGNFSPEVPKSGMYAMSTGQQPLGTLNPGQPRMELPASPMYQSGSRTSRRMGSIDSVEPMKALGTGENMIEADSWENRSGPGMSFGAQDQIHASLSDASNLSAMAGAGVGRPNMIGQQTPPAPTVGRRSAGLNPNWKPSFQPLSQPA